MRICREFNSQAPQYPVAYRDSHTNEIARHAFKTYRINVSATFAFRGNIKQDYMRRHKGSVNIYTSNLFDDLMVLFEKQNSYICHERHKHESLNS